MENAYLACGLLNIILEEIDSSVDYAPDISHTDQLIFTVRYIRGCEPVERLIKLIHIFSHGEKT